MRRHLFLSALLAAVFTCGCRSLPPRPANATLKTAGGPLVQAHRGSRGEWDDNALSGFRICLGHGIRGFETDIRFTKDHKLVIMHDARVNRTTDGDGTIEEMTFEEVRNCRLKASSEPVPTLDEVLQAIGGRDDIFVELEMKAYPSDFYTPEVLEEYCRDLSAMARRMLPSGTYTFTCFNTNTLAAMRKVDSRAPTGFITSRGLDESHIEIAKSLGCCNVSPNGHATTKEMVEKAHAAGLAVCLWMCQSKADWDEYREKGADRVTSDYPMLVREAIGGRHKKVVALGLDRKRLLAEKGNAAALAALEGRYKCMAWGDALEWARKRGSRDVVFVGDDFADGGKGADVRVNGYDHIIVTDYRKFASAVKVLTDL